MAKASVGAVRLIDSDGDALDDGAGKLNVNATLVDSSSIDIGDVSIQAGDGTPITDTVSGRLDVTLDSNSGVYSDDANFSLNSSKGIAIMGYQGIQSITSGDIGVLSCSTGGALKIMISETSTSVPTSSEATLGSISYTEGNTVGSVIGVVRNDTLAALAGTDNELAPLQVNASGALYVEVSSSATLSVNSHAVTNAGTFAVQSTLQAGTDIIGKVGHDITAMISNMDADIGTSAEKIHDAEDVAIKRIDIQAHRDNTGYIYVGDDGVAGNGTGGGIALAAGDFYSLDIDNTSKVYVASSVADEHVSYIYYR